jgi:membrane associated rhomboid family serine protease
MGQDSRDWYRHEAQQRPSGLPPLPSATKTLIIVNVACYLLQLISWKYIGWDPVTQGLGMIPEDVIGKFMVWQIFTSMFLHNPVSIWHLVFNMVVLYFFGPHVERRLGKRTFVKFYFLAGLAAGLAYVIFGILDQKYNPAVGASGAIMGVIVYFTMLNPNAIVRLMFIIPMKMKWATMIIVGIDVYYFVFAPGATNVANSAHLGGALFGFLYFKYGHRLDRFFTDMEVKAVAKKRQRERRSEAELNAELDRLLEKVHDVGINGLTEKERKTLNDVSRRLREKDR